MQTANASWISPDNQRMLKSSTQVMDLETP